jgi:hypothetical protein
MTTLAIALTACGLSIREGANYLGVRFDSVQKCAAGKARTPPGWLRDLKELAGKIERAASETLMAIEQAPADAAIELGVASDDHEAQSLGWPCRSAQIAAFARVWAALPLDRKVSVVPRGSTPGTAAASDAHEVILPR